jgi:hypothetical protein
VFGELDLGVGWADGWHEFAVERRWGGAICPLDEMGQFSTTVSDE